MSSNPFESPEGEENQVSINSDSESVRDVDNSNDCVSPHDASRQLHLDSKEIENPPATVDVTTIDEREKKPKKKRRRKRREDASEQRLLGRRALCKTIQEIAPQMLKTVKMRLLARHLDSKRGMDDDDLTARILDESGTLYSEEMILNRVTQLDPDVHRRNLKEIIVQVILLQEETYSLEERKLEERVIEYEQTLVDSSAEILAIDANTNDSQRAHNIDTYRIVLEAAWRNNDDISLDEAELLRVLRDRLDVSSEDHRQISASIERFPKTDCALHSRDEIHDARKELQRDGILWSYRDENSKSIDVIPAEIADVLRNQIADVSLQRTNYRRLLQHDCVTLPELRDVLSRHSMDKTGKKAELIERLVQSRVQPNEVVASLDRAKLSDMCRLLGIKSSGKKDELCARLIEFYDDLTFEERETQDEREEWYNNYESLASRAYADLRAKKLITKDLDVEHQFEKATDYLLSELLNLNIDTKRKASKADGRVILDGKRVFLWDCKSCEGDVNLQDFLDNQFDGYLRLERQKGFEPIAIMVIGPSFTSGSLKVALQYKARTNWDIALVRADAIKHVAEHWSAQETEQPFPVGLFNRTEIIDIKIAEFLISLA